MCNQRKHFTYLFTSLIIKFVLVFVSASFKTGLPQQPKIMRDVPRNSRVRRRLFAEDGSSDEARKDNCANVLLESIRRDQVKYSSKYNFDFKNETPLEGAYEWSKSDGNFDWIGRKSNHDNISDNGNIKEMVKSEEEIPDTESCLDMKLFNEVTPRIRHEETVPVARKRRIVSELDGDKAVRRKIDFE